MGNKPILRNRGCSKNLDGLRNPVIKNWKISPLTLMTTVQKESNPGQSRGVETDLENFVSALDSNSYWSDKKRLPAFIFGVLTPNNATSQSKTLPLSCFTTCCFMHWITVVDRLLDSSHQTLNHFWAAKPTQFAALKDNFSHTTIWLIKVGS